MPNKNFSQPKLITATSESELKKIVEKIVDEWFEPEKIFYDASNNTLSIVIYKEDLSKKRLIKKFLIFKKWKIPIVEWRLKIKEVEKWKIEDKEKHKAYFFENVKYNPSEKTIIFCAPFSFKIKVKVKKLDLVLQNTEKVEGFKEKWTI